MLEGDEWGRTDSGTSIRLSKSVCSTPLSSRVASNELTKISRPHQNVNTPLQPNFTFPHSSSAFFLSPSIPTRCPLRLSEIPRVGAALCRLSSRGRLLRRALWSARALLALFRCNDRHQSIRPAHLRNLKSGSPAAALKMLPILESSQRVTSSPARRTSLNSFVSDIYDIARGTRRCREVSNTSDCPNCFPRAEFPPLSPDSRGG